MIGWESRACLGESRRWVCLGSREKRLGFSLVTGRVGFWVSERKWRILETGKRERERDGNEGENGFGFFFIFGIPG